MANFRLTISSGYPFVAWHDRWRDSKITILPVVKGTSGPAKGFALFCVGKLIFWRKHYIPKALAASTPAPESICLGPAAGRRSKKRKLKPSERGPPQVIADGGGCPKN